MERCLYSQNQPRGIGLLSCTKDAILALHQGRPHRTARTKVAAVAGFEAQDVRPSHAADPEQRIIRRFDDFSARPMNVPLRAIILDRVKYHPEASELMICEGVALSVATQSIATRSIGTPWWRSQPKPLTEPHEAGIRAQSLLRSLIYPEMVGHGRWQIR